MKTCISLLIFAFTLTLAHGQTCAPFTNDAHHIVVNVKVNGFGPYAFLLDTGAAMTNVDAGLADLLHISPMGNVSVHGVGPIAVKGSLGDVSVTVAGHDAQNLRVVVLDMSRAGYTGGGKIHGILGMDFLEHFTVTIDNTHSCLLLQ